MEQLLSKAVDLCTKKRPHRRRSLLAFASNGRVTSSPASLGTFQNNRLSQGTSTTQQRRLQRAPSFGGFKWTPPLSPGTDKENSELKPTTPEQAMVLLRTRGLPPLADLKSIRQMVGTASRTWIRDFLIRGGRGCVNDKVREMAQLEMEARKHRPKLALLPKVFGSGKGDLPSRPTLREISEVREELMQLVLFLHLRE
ncbi:unnamed protein product [Ectocarpus sp. 12 AP-2014]